MSLEQFFNNEKKYCFNIDIRFNTKLPTTPRINEVSEAFGLGIEETKEFVIYDNFCIKLDANDIIFITGDSGGGKTLLLKKLLSLLESNNEKVLLLSNICPKADDVIIESIGTTMEEAIYFLSMMGLNDAYIFLRRYEELSDGQKYRYKLAKSLSLHPSILLIDEFCAKLDRTTAKVISYNIQRAARSSNMGLIVATTHNDIIDDLNPSIIVSKHFMDCVSIKYVPFVKKQLSFLSEMTVSLGSISDYKLLNKFHYKNTKTNFPYVKIVTLKHKDELAGVVVFSPPFLQTKGRTIKFDKKYSMMKTEVVKEINDLFIRGARYVISPKYRGCGLGQKLVIDSLPFVKDKKYLEVITVMGRYNPVFEKSGMEKIEITEETDSAALKLTEWLKVNNCNLIEINNTKYFKSFIDSLNDIKKDELKLLTGKVLHHPKIGISSSDGKRAEVVKQEQRYKTVTFKDVRNEILAYIPKLYSGMSIYYVLENPHYTGTK